MTHDRTGERIDDDALTRSHLIAENQVIHSASTPHGCHRGWLGEDLDGRPIPCLRCRPHLRKTAGADDHAHYR